MSFEIEELEDILVSLKQRVYILNATAPEELVRLLKTFDVSCDSLLKESNQDAVESSCASGLILIAGDSQVKRNNLEGMIKEKFPQLKGRMRYALDYDTLKNYQNPSKYEFAVILVGPAPHKLTGIGDSSSAIERLIENEDGYFPPTYKLSANSSIKITKSNVEEKLASLISEGIIQ